MPPEQKVLGIDEHLQVLDVHVVDVLAHLEALLRHSHSIQRALLQLRGEAPPPRVAPPKAVLADLRDHAQQMGQECRMLGEIITDLAAGIEMLGGGPDTESRGSSENRRVR
jgi:hypothetical protein